jgi:hypothetical protein
MPDMALSAALSAKQDASMAARLRLPPKQTRLVQGRTEWRQVKK